jgi:hypothetical protein
VAADGQSRNVAVLFQATDDQYQLGSLSDADADAAGDGRSWLEHEYARQQPDPGEDWDPFPRSEEDWSAPELARIRDNFRASIGPISGRWSAPPSTS